MERWMAAYAPREGYVVPGLPNSAIEAIDVPSLVFRSGLSDANHTRATSEAVAGLLPDASLVEPPWEDHEWVERSRAARESGTSLFVRWPRLVPQLVEWSDGLVQR
jgi:hypothetical protein